MNIKSIISRDVLMEAGAKAMNLKKGESIYTVGETVPGVYIVERGGVKISYFNEEGREFVFAIIAPGELFGYTAIITNTLSTATATTTEATQVLFLNKDKFIALLLGNPPLMYDMLVEINERLRQITLQLGQMAVEDAEYRLGTLMNYYKNRRGLSKDHEYVVPLTRQQLADMTGLRVETVIRTIKQMEQKGLLEIIEGKIFWTPKRSEGVHEHELAENTLS